MKKFYLLILLMLFSKVFALCQVTVTLTIGGKNTPITVPTAGLKSQTFLITLSKSKFAAVGDGRVRIYAQGLVATLSGALSTVNIPVSAWGTGDPQTYASTQVLSVYQSAFGDFSGVIFAQYENGATSYKSNLIKVNIPISNNSITAPVTATFVDSGNPAVITGTVPTGGNNSYKFQWQLSTTSSTLGFTNIASATSSIYDPPTINKTSYYRRVVTSDGLTNTSNVITITITIVPITNNVISNSGSSVFFGNGDPSLLIGSQPIGGNNFFNYKWQSSTTSATTGFNDIPSATSQKYDPPKISQTTFYRRIVTSSSQTNTSNTINITIRPIGADFNNPFNIGELNIGGSYTNSINPDGYGDEFGNPYEDVFYRFNLVKEAKVTINNCKNTGASSRFYLLDSGGIPIQSESSEDCDWGIITTFNLQPSIYYVVVEVADIETDFANVSIQVTPRCSLVSISPDIAISAGSSTTLSVSGTDNSYTYSWGPSTGLSSTTGAVVTASPVITTTYTVYATRPDKYCTFNKSVTVTVAGLMGSTIDNPIIADIGGCGYVSPLPFLNTTDYGNEFGRSEEDIFFKFTLPSESEVLITSEYSYLDFYEGSGLHVELLNSSGQVIDAQDYGWMNKGNSGNDDFYYGELDGTPLKPMLQSGTYFLVAEGVAGFKRVAIGIKTPTGYSCRKSSGRESTNENFSVVNTGEPKVPIQERSVIGHSLYPNPASDFIMFDLEKDVSYSIYILDGNGVTLKESTLFGTDLSASLNVRDLPIGLYFARIVHGNKVRYEKIAIER